MKEQWASLGMVMHFVGSPVTFSSCFIESIGLMQSEGLLRIDEFFSHSIIETVMSVEPRRQIGRSHDCRSFHLLRDFSPVLYNGCHPFIRL